MTYYSVEPKSRNDLRLLAHNFREILGLENCLYFPIVELLDVMSKIFDDFSYEIVSDEEMSENVHASTDIRTGLIKIKESVYEGACKGNGRDRMTIAHEMDIILCFVFVGLH